MFKALKFHTEFIQNKRLNGMKLFIIRVITEAAKAIKYAVVRVNKLYLRYGCMVPYVRYKIFGESSIIITL